MSPTVLDAILICVALVALVSGRISMEAVFLTFITACIVLERLSFREVLSLLADPSIFTVICFVVFARVLTQLHWLRGLVLGSGGMTLRGTMARFLGVVGLVSAFVPNTAVVGAFIGPASRHPKIPAHQLLLPLSYMALAGGMVTPFGTSANLMVVGQAAKSGINLTIFHFMVPGLAVYASVLLCLVIFSPMLLRTATSRSLENQSDLFHIEAKVLPGSRLIGGSIASNKLRNLDHFFVAEIVRGDFVIGPVHPSEVIREGDVLIFVGDVRFIADLQTIGGLETELSNRPMRGDSIYHAVVASNSILAGATLKGMSFRSHFDASVLAIRRGRERLSGKLGEIEIHAGDVLVISAGPDFFARDDVQPNLHVLEVEDPGQPALGLHDSVLIVSLFLSLIGLALSGLIDLGFATLILVLAALAMGWLREREVRRTFPFDLVILLWGSLTLGLLLDKSGLADVIANGILSMTDGYHPVLGLITLFMVTWILTEFLSNNSAALAAFPIALALATRLSLPAEAYVLAVAFGSSASFLVPFGYQTHLMVLTPGKYRFSDFLSLGVLVFLFYGAASMTTISLLYLR